MVAHSGATNGPDRIRPFDIAQGRPLNRPRPVRVEANDDGRPASVYLSGRRWAVEAVLETWRIDDEWWRQRSVSRRYFTLLLEDGRTVTIFQDATSGRWAMQAY